MERRVWIAAALLLVPGVASAEPAEQQSFGIDRLALPLSGDPVLVVESGTARPRGSWNAAAWLGFQDDPLVLEQGGRRLGALVDDRSTLTLVGSYAVLDGVELGAVLPTTLAQDRDAGIAGVDGALAPISGVGLEDLKLSAKVAWRGARAHGFDLAGRLALLLPTAGATDYRGDPGWALAPEIDLSGTARGIRFAATAGYRWRSESARFDDVTVDDEVFASLGVGYHPLPRWRPAIALTMATAAGTATTSRDRDHVELLVGTGWTPPACGMNLELTVMGGGGFAHSYGTPDARVVVGLSLTYEAKPRVADPDHDGVRGRADRCPDDPEDHDGFEDSDGCSEPDNDDDGILDFDDKAPNDPRAH